MSLFDRFLAVLAAFEQEKVEYILIGGFAVILHGLPRLTQDLDILVKMTPENIAKLRTSLMSVFDDESINEITLQELKKYAVIRYNSLDGFFIDIMAGVGEVADFNTIKFETTELEGVTIKIATTESLYELKKNTVRPEDKRDALFLKELIDKQKNKDAQ